MTWIKSLFGLVPSVAKSLIPNPWMLAIGLVLIAGAYGFGSYRGDAAGYNRAEVALTASYTTQLNAKQDQINALVTADNVAASTANTKITALEAQSAADAQSIVQMQSEVNSKRTAIVTRYIAANKSTALQCGLSTASVQAITDMLSIKQ